jgi:putative tricarboxylic transport membrane protein
MVLYDRILGFIWLLLGLAICFMSHRIDLGEVSSPGPGFIPFLTGCLLILLSSIYLLKSRLFPADSHWKKNFWEGIRWDKSLCVAGALLAYIFLLPVLGYLVLTFLFMAFLGKIIQPQKWSTILIISAVSAVTSYLVFGLWLHCQFPKGLFRF